LQTRHTIEPTADAIRRRRRPIIIELPHDWQAQRDSHRRAVPDFKPMPLPEGPLLSSYELAQRLGVSQRWVTDKHHAGHLTGYRLPGSNRLRFDWREVMACLQKSEAV
jgi:hypothetical protein